MKTIKKEVKTQDQTIFGILISGKKIRPIEITWDAQTLLILMPHAIAKRRQRALT